MLCNGIAKYLIVDTCVSIPHVNWVSEKKSKKKFVSYPDISFSLE